MSAFLVGVDIQAEKWKTEEHLIIALQAGLACPWAYHNCLTEMWLPYDLIQFLCVWLADHKWWAFSSLLLKQALGCWCGPCLFQIVISVFRSLLSQAVSGSKANWNLTSMGHRSKLDTQSRSRQWIILNEPAFLSQPMANWHLHKKVNQLVRKVVLAFLKLLNLYGFD